MKKVKKLVIVLMAALLMLCVQTVPAKAATTLAKLKAGKTYTGYDITRDGRKDRFLYKSSSYQATVYVNNKKVAAISGGKAVKPTLYYWKVSKKDTYILVQGASTGGFWYGAYQYKSGKLKKVYSFSASELTDSGLYKASGKYLYMKYYAHRYGTFSLRHSRGLAVRFKYQTSNGKISLASRSATITSGRNFKALNSFRTSSVRGQYNTKGVYVKKGAAVRLTQVYLDKSGKMWYKVYAGGKGGWFPEDGRAMLK